MKYITNSRVRIKGRKELRGVFQALRFKDGLTEKAEANEFTYWYNKSRDGEIGNYVIYEVLNTETLYRADDVSALRLFQCQIDIFSVYSFETKQLSDVLEALEKQLVKTGFTVEMSMEEYEQDTRLYHAVFIALKVY